MASHQLSMEGMTAWRGKTALVTGASSGIGQAIARRLCAEGMKVVGCARRAERLEALRAELEGAEGELLPVTADLRDEAQILSMFTTARERFGGVDVLVNNAGLGTLAPLMSGATERWREMLEVNVLALCICTREGVSDMRSRGNSGHIIHISSMSGHRVPTASGVYSATKFAVRSLTESLRQELRAEGSQIRVTAISPGFVETEFAAIWNQRPEAAAETYGRYPVIQADELADMVVYALSRPAHVQIHDLLVRPTDQPS
jgi:NADP-dependent 3-hydroxy acid dehydrogenase YdfG